MGNRKICGFAVGRIAQSDLHLVADPGDSHSPTWFELIRLRHIGYNCRLIVATALFQGKMRKNLL
jgi:hypothetical protein